MSIKRFSLSQRIAHFLIALSIMSLFITGMPLLFKQHWLIMILGGEKVTMFLHRVFAIVLMATSLYLIIRNISIREMIFTPKDIKDFFGDVSFSLGKAEEEPKYGKYSWIMKASFWFACFEILVFIITGLILWFPFFFTQIIPRYNLLTAAEIHRTLAIMAFLHFSAHSFGNHLHPREFPLNKVIFTGEVSEEKAKHEYPLWYEKLEAGEK